MAPSTATTSATPVSGASAAAGSAADDDERLLARIGYKQSLRREFNTVSTISYAISILGILGSVPATFASPIMSGGPATAVWAWFIGSVMAMCIASSVAELVSAYPTAGGMYFVTKHVVPPEHVAIWAWVIGWCNFLGQAAGVASLCFTISQMILAAVVMNTDAYSPTAWQTIVLAVGVLCIVGVICSLATKSLHRIIMWFAPINILATAAICIALLVLTPNKQSATWVFTTVTDGSGWGSRGFSFLLGFLSVAWTMTDYDATTHMSEETHRAATLGPLSIRLAILVSGITGWLLTITLCFCLNDWDGIVRSRTGLPAAQIFLNAGGPAGGTVMWAFCILVQCFTATAAMLGNARMAYAFARDGAFPFSGLWSTISATTGTPVYAVWLVVGFCTVLLAIGFGSLETIVSVFSICAPALDISYIAVIVAHRVYEHRVRFVPGPYTLGRWSRPVNYVSICWVTFISVILFFPPVWPVTAKNMNYAVVVAAFVGIFSLGWWWAGARKTYIGPRTKDVVASSGSSSTAGVVEDEEEEAGAGGPAHGREGRESGVASPEPATSRGVSSEAGRV